MGGRRNSAAAQAPGQSRKGWEFPLKKETSVQQEQGLVQWPVAPALYQETNKILLITTLSPVYQMPGEALSYERIFSTTSTLKTAETIGFGTFTKHMPGLPGIERASKCISARGVAERGWRDDAAGQKKKTDIISCAELKENPDGFLLILRVQISDPSGQKGELHEVESYHNFRRSCSLGC